MVSYALLCNIHCQPHIPAATSMLSFHKCINFTSGNNHMGWMPHQKGQLRAWALTAVLAACATAQAADPAPLAEAEALLAAGKLNEAYVLLAPLEFEYSGIPKFDLMFGYAALEAGHASVASLAFERVLALEPTNPEARLHLARAYVALNDPDSARREFESLLAASPTQSIRETIGQYLSALQAAQAPERLQLSGYVETSVGFDSNVTGSTAQQIIAIPIDPQQLQLPDSAVQAESPFVTLDAGGTALYSLSKDLAAYAGADILNRRVSRVDELDYMYVTGRAGLWKQFDNQSLRGGINASDFALDGDSFRQSAGADLEYRRTFAERVQGALNGAFTAFRHRTEEARGEDFDLVSVTGSVSRLFGAGGEHLASISLDYGHENDLHVRADGNRDYYGGRLSGQYRLAAKVNAYAAVGFQQSDYATRSDIFLVTREESQWNSAAGLNFTITPSFTIRPGFTWLDQSSNIPLYDYTRWTASVSFHVDFL